MLTKKKRCRGERKKEKTFLSNKPPQNNLCDQIRQLVVVVLIRRTSVAKVVEDEKFSLDISSTVDLGTKIGFTTAWAYNRSGDSRRKVSPASSTSNDGAFRARFLSLLIFGEKEKKRKKDCFFFSFYFTTGLHKISHASSWLPRPLFLYLVRRFFGTPQKKKQFGDGASDYFPAKDFFKKLYFFWPVLFNTPATPNIHLYIPKVQRPSLYGPFSSYCLLFCCCWLVYLQSDGARRCV